MIFEVNHQSISHNHCARVITYTYTVDKTEGIINFIFIHDKERNFFLQFPRIPYFPAADFIMYPIKNA